MKLRLWLTLTVAAAGLVVFTITGLFFHFFVRHSSEQFVIQAAFSMMNTGGRTECESSPGTWFVEAFGKDKWPVAGSVRPMPGEPRSREHDRPRGPGPLGFGIKGARLPMHVQVFAFDSGLNPSNPDTPALDRRLRAKFDGEQTLHVSSVGGVLNFVKDDAWACDGRDHGPGCPPSDGMKKPGEMRIHEMLVPMTWKEGPCAIVLIRWDEPVRETSIFHISPPIAVWGLPVAVMLLTVLIAAGPVVRRIRRLTSQVRRSAADRYRTPIALKGTDEIGQLAGAFENARAEILDQVARQEEREQNLREFLENTTHDISIPLTVLQGHLSDLAAGEGGHRDESVASAMAETNYLAALIGNLSIASRLETGTPTMQQVPVDLNALIGRCVIRHRPLARQRSVNIDHAIPEEPVVTTGDMTFIEQAVNNVTFNAIRYNKPGGHVAVILEAAPDDRFTISIIDDGPGIPDDQMAAITERYYRCGKERSRESHNQGIGLNIAGKVAAMHGWRFNISRSEFGGLRVDFEGPA